MLNNQPFYYQMLRKYIIAVEHILSDIVVQRFDDNWNVVKEINVPVTLAGKQKIFYYLENETTAINPILPRISFMLSGMTNDETRKENATNTITLTGSDNESIEFQYSGKPYNLSFSVSVWAEYVDDLFQIIEQVSSFFNPDFCVTVKEIDQLNIHRDVEIVLEDIDINLTTEMSEDTSREVVADLVFTVKGFIYPPIKEDNVIQHIDQQFFDMEDNEME